MKDYVFMEIGYDDSLLVFTPTKAFHCLYPLTICQIIGNK